MTLDPHYKKDCVSARPVNVRRARVRDVTKGKGTISMCARSRAGS